MKPMNLKKHLQDPAFRKWAMASSLVLALSASISFNPESKDSRSLQIVSMSSKVDKNAKEEIIQLSNNNKYSVAVEKDPNDKKKLKIKVTRNTEGTFCLDCSTSEETFISSEDITDTSFHTNDKLKALVTNLVLKLENPTKVKQKEEEKKPSTEEEKRKELADRRKDLLAKAKEECKSEKQAFEKLYCATEAIKAMAEEKYTDEKGKERDLFEGPELTKFFKENFAGSLISVSNAPYGSLLARNALININQLVESNVPGMSKYLSQLLAADISSQLELENKKHIHAYANLAQDPNDVFARSDLYQSKENLDQLNLRIGSLEASFNSGFNKVPVLEEQSSLKKDFKESFSRPLYQQIRTIQKNYPAAALQALREQNPNLQDSATNVLNQNPNGQIQNGSSFSRDRFYNGQTPFTNGGQFQPNIGTNQNQLFNPNQQAFPQTQFTNTNSNVLMPPR